MSATTFQQALAKAQQVRWLAPDEALTSDLKGAEAWASGLLQEHLQRLSHIAKGPLAAVSAYASRDATEICHLAGFPRQTGTNSPTIALSMPPLAPGIGPWRQALREANNAMSVALRARHAAPAPDNGFLQRLMRKVSPTAPSLDPWNELTSSLDESLRPLRWAEATSIMSLALQWGERRSSRVLNNPIHALREHLLWGVIFPEEPSPWEPILSLWARGAWPVACQDGSVALYLPLSQKERVLPTRNDGPPMVAAEVGDGWIQYSADLPLGVMPYAGMANHSDQSRDELLGFAMEVGLGPPPCRLSFPPVGNPPFRA